MVAAETKEKRLIYVTMGTTGIADFFHKVYGPVNKTELRVVMTTGGQVEGLENVEGTIYLEKFLDGDLVSHCDEIQQFRLSISHVSCLQRADYFPERAPMS